MKKYLSIIAFVGLLSLPAFSQGPPSGGPPSGGNCIPPPCIPIDGGMSFLLVAGALYGGKKLLDQKKH